MNAKEIIREYKNQGLTNDEIMWAMMDGEFLRNENIDEETSEEIFNELKYN